MEKLTITTVNGNDYISQKDLLKDTDRRCAMNAGIKYMDVEEFINKYK